MARVTFDRVKETSTTTGTGDFTLAGAATGYRAFSSVMSTGDTCFYTIQGTSEWEVGFGTYGAANTLTRTSVSASSNSGSPVSFSAGSKDVFVTYPAYRVGYGPTFSDTAPSNPAAGDFWWDSSTGTLRIYYTDANTSQWVDAVPGLSSGFGVTLTSGTTTVDFGSFPGAPQATTVVTGQAAILSSSIVRVRLWPTATADHSADEHIMAAIMLDLIASDIVPGTGFSINALTRPQPGNLGFPVRPDRGLSSATAGQNTALQQGVFPSVGGEDNSWLYGQFTVLYEWS